MNILDTTTRKLTIVLGGAVTTNDVVFTAAYVDIDTATYAVSGVGHANGTVGDATAVDLVAAPAAETVRQVKGLTVYNADTVAATVTVAVDDNGTARTVFTATLAPGDQAYMDGAAWVVNDDDGQRKAVTT